VQLNDYEQAMLSGEFGPGRQQALRQQIEVGEFFDAADFIEVSQVHLMADTESLGESGVVYLEELAALPASQCRVLVPTVTDPRGIDLCGYQRLRQRREWATLDGAPQSVRIEQADIQAFYTSPGRRPSQVDVVVLAAPQLSLLEMQHVAALLDGRHVHRQTDLVIATSPEIKAACDRLGVTARVEDAGAILLEGVCFYQMYARETGELNGWRYLVSNSAKLVNIIQGYGYEPRLATTAQCIDAAVNGRLA